MPSLPPFKGGFLYVKRGELMGFRTVFVKNGERLNLKLDNLEVSKDGQSITIPLSDIESVMLEGDHTIVTTRLLAKLAQHHIDVIICDSKFMPCGIYLGLGQYHRSAKRAAWQSTWEELLKKNAWTYIVSQKILNQIEVASYLEVDTERIRLMTDLYNNLLIGDESNREGHVAKVYFNSIFGNGFSREDDIFPNHCLDYGYAVIRAQVARCVVALGLLPMLGIFHRNEYNSFNLVDDLMEPFRPLLDWYVFQNILSTNAEYLSYDIRLILADFLHQQIKVKGKKIYMMQAIADYVNSFIKAMETNEFKNLHTIEFKGFMECMGK